MNRAVFLDRDGTINIDKGYVYRTEDFVFLDGFIEALKVFHELNYYVIVITNQSGVARGYYGEEDVIKLHQYMDEELKKSGTYIDAYYYCPHHKDGKVKKYAIDCNCRKPKSGLILKAKEDFNLNLKASILIGDKQTDIDAANNAKVGNTLLISNTALYYEIKSYIKKWNNKYK
jgi:D-glycero-D-manno-heptose 1,7-bisphosphate phosphatase